MSLGAIAETNAVSMTDDKIREFLRTEGVGTLALPQEDLPYTIPLSFGYDGQRSLYFVFLLFGAESRKETLAERAGRGRFLVYRAESIRDWQSVSLTGSLEPVEDEWDALRESMANAWHPDLFSTAQPMRGVRGYRFRIEDWTGIMQAGSTN